MDDTDPADHDTGIVVDVYGPTEFRFVLGRADSQAGRALRRTALNAESTTPA